MIVQENRILSIGYNGTPVNVKNCYENGCERCNENYPQGVGLEKCMCLHAEESAILEVGKKLCKGATLYCTLFPCLWCSKMIIQCEISEIYFVEEFNNHGSMDLLKQTKIRIVKLPYDNRVN